MGHPSSKCIPEFKQMAMDPYHERSGTSANFARELGCNASSISNRVRKAAAAQVAPKIGRHRPAIAATASNRGSNGRMSDYVTVLGKVRESGIMRGIWALRVAGFPYAAGLDFGNVVDSAFELARLVELDELE